MNTLLVQQLFTSEMVESTRHTHGGLRSLENKQRHRIMEVGKERVLRTVPNQGWPYNTI